MAQVDEIEILHFNDVYHTSDASLVARFATVLSDPRHVVGDAVVAQHQLRIFSGDVFSPSLESSVLRGDHMTDLLNVLNIDVACYGNHDFDFGEARLSDLSKQTNFPWTLANAVRKQPIGAHDRLLAQAHEHVVKEVAGYRIGFFGLAGSDWPSNCQHLPSCDILNPVAVARKLASHLRRSEKCDLVVAVTHMRLAQDISLSLGTMSGDESLDLILGGHDHHVIRRTSTDMDANPAIVQQGIPNSNAACTDFKGHVRIVKSGTDWRGLSIARLIVGRQVDGSAFVSSLHLKQISNLTRMPKYHQIPPCSKTLRVLASTHARIEKLVQQPVLYTDVPLEGRSAAIRSQGTNLGNMLADAVKAFYDTDIALVNSGGIRCDRLIQPHGNAPLRIRDLVDISPFDNPLVVKRISGRVLAVALENSVSDAHTDGRFLQLSGLSISVNWSCRQGHRVVGLYYLPRPDAAPQTLHYDQIYTVAMTNFIASGFDGYSCFQIAETLVDVEGAMTDTKLLLEIFGGAFTSRGTVDGDIADKATAGIFRAREAIIQRWNESDGLPVVGPRLEDRIKVISGANL